MNPRFVKWQKPAPPSETEAEAQLQQDGYDVFRWTDVPGSQYPQHQHHVDECIWVLSGEITFVIEEAAYRLQAGDRLYLPSKIRHTAQVPKNITATYLVGQKRH